MARAATGRRGLVWAAVGAGVLAVGIVALIAVRLSSEGPRPVPSGSATVTSPPGPSETGPSPTTAAVVEASVSEKGLDA